MKKAMAYLVALIVIMVIAACRGQSNGVDEHYESGSGGYEAVQIDVPEVVSIFDQPRLAAERNENLAKLGKVWGFVKYTHHSFISGQLDWDAELLNLIPVIYNSDAEAVNDILYDWFINLGEDGFGLAFGHDFNFSVFLEMWANELARLEALGEATLIGHHTSVDAVIEYREIYEFFSALSEAGYDLNWLAFEMLLLENFPDSQSVIWQIPERSVVLRPVSDLSWINYEYLGPLASHLLQFDGVAATNKTRAPVSFHPGFGTPNFSNQNLHTYADLGDTGYRLLGLFRLWNAMKYYYPHLGILDVEWNSLLLEYIYKILGGEDRLSYELTLAALSHHLRDSAHLIFFGMTFFQDKFGNILAPVQLIEAEGRLVVYGAARSQLPLTREILQLPLEPLEIGDVILELDGRDINEIIAEMLRFVSYPNEEKALAYLALFHHPLRSHTRNMEITVLRGDAPITLNVNGVVHQPVFTTPVTQPYEFIDNNIGLINPHEPFRGDVRHIMEEFAATDGIIIDLRQYPDWNFFLEMRQYLMDVPLPFAYRSRPSQTHPGMRVDELVNQYLPLRSYAFVYDRPIVLLMDERTISRPEWVIMAFRDAPNVTVIGPWSMGSNGEIAWLPLPGGITMIYTSVGIYTLEGGQTHRIGLEPDIRVNRTIQSIAEGRDKLMEAAVQYIIS